MDPAERDGLNMDFEGGGIFRFRLEKGGFGVEWAMAVSGLPISIEAGAFYRALFERME